MLYTKKDVGRNKASVAKEVLKRINQNIDVKIFKKKIDQNNIKKIAEKYQIICDGTDNFKTRFLVNDYCLKNKKILVTSAISKFDGQLFKFDFNPF